MTICRLLMQTELRHALGMIKGGVCVEKDPPQEARRRINKQTSTIPLACTLDSSTGLFFPHRAEEEEEALYKPDQSRTWEALSYTANGA